MEQHKHDLIMDEEEAEATLNQLNSLFATPGFNKRNYGPHGNSGEGVEFNTRLIAAVEKRPLLYDPRADHYPNAFARAEAWKDIAAELGGECTKTFAKTRWKTLRDRFNKEDKKTRSSGRRSTWNFYEPMIFLSPHLKADLEMQTLSAPPMDDIDIAPHLNLKPIVSLADLICDDPDTASPSSSHDSPAERLEPLPSPQVPLSVPRSDARPPKRARASPPLPRDQPPIQYDHYNEDEVFGHMIALRLAKFSGKQKELAKLRLLSTLIDVEFDT